MEIQDDRTAEQRKTHRCLIIGTDTFMSGWGKAEGGASYAAWACTPEDAFEVERWVRHRGDQIRVRCVYDTPSRRWHPRGTGHAHIYVVENGHPSLGGR